MHYLLYCLLWNLLLVSVVAAILWLLGFTHYLRERPALRHSLWLLVLLKFVTPPLVPVPLLPTVQNNLLSPGENLPVSQDTNDSAPVVGELSAEYAVGPELARGSGVDWSRVVSIAVITAACLSSLVTVVLWSIAVLQLRWLRRMTVSMTGASERATHALQHVSETFKLAKIPGLVVADASCSPMLWVDFRRATIILPRAFAQSCSDEQLHHVLAHEIAHLVRYDHLSSFLAFFVTSLFWWNPVAWLARREMLIATETCSDALALERSSGSRQSYAQTLLAAVDYVAQNKTVSPALVPHFGETQSLKRRIEMVASSQVKSALSGSSRLIVLSCGLVALTLLPVQAQQVSQSQLNATEQGILQVAPAAEQPIAEQNEKNKAVRPNTAEDNQPTIANAKLVGWSGLDTSTRAYFFESEPAAESFAKVIAAFKIATRFKVVISETEPMVFDHDKKSMVMPPNFAKQLELDSNKFVMLSGTRKEHARVEELMRALDAD